MFEDINCLENRFVIYARFSCLLADTGVCRCTVSVISRSHRDTKAAYNRSGPVPDLSLDFSRVWHAFAYTHGVLTSKYWEGYYDPRSSYGAYAKEAEERPMRKHRQAVSIQ